MSVARVTAQLLLLAALPTLTGRGWWCAEGEVVSVTAVEGWRGPEFLPAETTLITAVGQDAQLDCRVRNLGDKAVSWVRSQDLNILSHAGAVFTADARVSVRVAGAGAGAATHSLRIQRLRLADGGRYECQLNTDPKMSLFFNLTVLEEPMPVAVIEALSREVRGAAGGAAALRCDARYEPPPRDLPLPPLDIAWTRGGQPVDLQRVQGGVSRDTERWAWRAASRLTLGALAAADAGLYRCHVVGDDRAADYIQLYVDAESQMEAMQRDQSLDSGAPLPRARLAAVLALLLLLAQR